MCVYISTYIYVNILKSLRKQWLGYSQSVVQRLHNTVPNVTTAVIAVTGMTAELL